MIHHRGITAGIYATNSPDACQFVAENSRANVVVVENDAQLSKILQVRQRLPLLKAIVQYTGEVRGSRPKDVYTVGADRRCGLVFRVMLYCVLFF